MNSFRKACKMSCEDWVNSLECEDKIANKSLKRKILSSTSSKRAIVKFVFAAALIVAVSLSAFAAPLPGEAIVKDCKNGFDYCVAVTYDVKEVEELTLGFLPEGFSKSYEFASRQLIVREYSNSKTTLCIKKFMLDSTLTIASRDYVKSQVNSIDYILFFIENKNTLVWNNGEYIYALSSDMSREDLLEIAYKVN